MVTVYISAIAAIIIFERLFDLRLAACNRKKLLEMGAREFGCNHYPLFFILHTGWFIGWLFEGLAYNKLGQFWQLWVIVFLAADLLRYWCIFSLGQFWNTRILVIPGEKSVQCGPYRFFAHPNYLAVALVILSVPLIFGAWITAVICSILNAALLLCVRIPAEEQALRELKYWRGSEKEWRKPPF